MKQMERQVYIYPRAHTPPEALHDMGFGALTVPGTSNPNPHPPNPPRDDTVMLGFGGRGREGVGCCSLPSAPPKEICCLGFP